MRVQIATKVKLKCSDKTVTRVPTLAQNEYNRPIIDRMSFCVLYKQTCCNNPQTRLNYMQSLFGGKQRMLNSIADEVQQPSNDIHHKIEVM